MTPRDPHPASHAPGAEALQEENRQLREALQALQRRHLDLERQLASLELDSERVQRLLDDYGVPRYMPSEEHASQHLESGPLELSLLGRVSLLLEEEEEQDE